jgi:hypothetical protein
MKWLEKFLVIPRSFIFLYFGFGTVCTGLYFRLAYAFPNTILLTQLSNIDEVASAIDGHWSRISLLQFGTGHSTNGYRFIQIINGKLFGLNSHIELVLYYLVVFLLGVILVEWWRNKAASINRNPWPVSILVLALLASLVSAGSGGMEIGTFIGLLFQVGIFSFATRDNPSKSTFINILIISILQFLCVFYWLGAYAIPVIFSWFAVFIALRFSKSKLIGTQVNLLTGTVSTLVAVVLWTIGVLSTSSPNSFAASLPDRIRESPSYPFRYMVRALPAGIISDKTLEGFSATQIHLLVYGLFGFLLIPLALALVASIKNRDIPLLPLFLVSHGLILALILMINRPFGINWLLSTWYGLQFKLLVCGIILMWACKPGQDDSQSKSARRIVSIFSLSCLVLILLFANNRQWNRQPSERKYFQAIQEATINPNLLIQNESGLTQILLSYDESLRVIKILDQYDLGVFSGKARMTKIDPNLISLSGDAWDDGWIGSKVTLRVGSSCEQITLKFSTTANNPLVTVHLMGEIKQQIVVHDKGAIEVAVPSDSLRDDRTIDLVADQLWSPKEQGLNSDQRLLSVVMSAICSRPSS